jgi:hypothetical protein
MQWVCESNDQQNSPMQWVGGSNDQQNKPMQWVDPTSSSVEKIFGATEPERLENQRRGEGAMPLASMMCRQIMRIKVTRRHDDITHTIGSVERHRRLPAACTHAIRSGAAGGFS